MLSCLVKTVSFITDLLLSLLLWGRWNNHHREFLPVNFLISREDYQVVFPYMTYRQWGKWNKQIVFARSFWPDYFPNRRAFGYHHAVCQIVNLNVYCVRSNPVSELHEYHAGTTDEGNLWEHETIEDTDDAHLARPCLNYSLIAEQDRLAFWGGYSTTALCLLLCHQRAPKDCGVAFKRQFKK
jgi:hypothetical protein